MSTYADEAARLVLGERNQSYGSPPQDFARVAQVWSGLLASKLKHGEVITPENAVLMMVGLKLCRQMNARKGDNLVDAHGYLLCAEWIIAGAAPVPEAHELSRAVEDVACGTRMQCGKCGQSMPCLCEHE